jgi:hypothetical protein
MLQHAHHHHNDSHILTDQASLWKEHFAANQPPSSTVLRPEDVSPPGTACLIEDISSLNSVDKAKELPLLLPMLSQLLWQQVAESSFLPPPHIFQACCPVIHASFSQSLQASSSVETSSHKQERPSSSMMPPAPASQFITKDHATFLVTSSIGSHLLTPPPMFYPHSSSHHRITSLHSALIRCRSKTS